MLLISYLALMSGYPLAYERLQIARQVAGTGVPNCIAYKIDGSVRPCLPWFEIISDRHVNAWRIGSRIVFSQGAIAEISRDEFALLAGHEIAHLYLGHKDPSNPRDELAADRLGSELACQAGFSPAAGMSVFRLFGPGITHPRQAERRAAVLSIPCKRKELA